MSEDEILTEVNALLLSDRFVLFDKAFFNEEIPQPINSIIDANDVEKIIVWIKNDQYEPKCSSKGVGKLTGKFFFDIYKDPIVEIDLGRTNNKMISSSRLYYKTGWILNEELRDAHTKSTNRIVRTFKKKLTTTIRLKPFYISEDI